MNIPLSHRAVWDAFVKQANFDVFRDQDGDGSKGLSTFVAVARAAPTPWPPALLDAMSAYHPPIKQTRHSEFTRWVNKVKAGHDHALEALEVCFAGGFSPARFIPQSRVSTLGMAAYQGVLEVVELAYEYMSKEEGRLVMLAEHLPHTDSEQVGSTLLHRLVERTNHNEYLYVAKIILKHDPEACLQQRKDGLYPDMLHSNQVSALCLHERTRLQREELEKEVGHKGKDTKRIPKI